MGRARAAAAAGSHYVALGSSFAAGLGLGPRAPGSPFVSLRSVNGYPRKLAEMINVPSFTDMTSSETTVTQILQGGPVMLPPQVDALGAGTRLVTLTGGGNDIGYVGDLLAMAYRNRGGLPGLLFRAFRKAPRPAGQRDFRGLDVDLRALLREIVRRAPEAHVVVATYPTILPVSGPYTSIRLTDEQASMMRSVASELADVTSAAAESIGATVVDMHALSKGRDACSEDPWVYGFRPAAGASFHPTAVGAVATALAIATALKAHPRTYDSC